jgi:hypothetical protein
MPYCNNCGTPVKAEANFCQSCGNRLAPVIPAGQGGVQATVPVYSPATEMPVSNNAEPIIALIPSLNKTKALGLKDTYNLIVTPTRSIFIKLTTQFAQKASQFNMERNPNQNKSLWSRWKAQVAGPNIYLLYLSSQPPEQSLRESSENFALDNIQIGSVRCKFRFSDEDPSEWQIEFQSGIGNYKFVTESNPESLLKTAYGGRFSK